MTEAAKLSRPSHAKAGFLHLPLELRIQIYTYVFGGCITFLGEHCLYYPLPSSIQGLLLANRIILSEFTTLANKHHVSQRLTFERASQCLLYFRLAENSFDLSRLRSLSFTLDCAFRPEIDRLAPIFDFLTSNPKLQSLSINLKAVNRYLLVQRSVKPLSEQLWGNGFPGLAEFRRILEVLKRKAAGKGWELLVYGDASFMILLRRKKEVGVWRACLPWATP